MAILLSYSCASAQILSELDHPNIVAFHELGESNGLLYFAMDYVAGIDGGIC